jgi:hypothetical protein
MIITVRSGDLWPRGYLQPSDVIPSRMEQG